jgi:hypothetical protein
VTFDARGRIVTICVGLARPVMHLMDPKTLATLATYELPARQLGAGPANPFTDFAGGGYFYLDERDRAIVPTTTRHLLVIGQTDQPGFKVEADFNLSPHVSSGDKIFAVMPDWRGNIWFASQEGVMGIVDPASGAVRVRALGEAIANSFAVDETGGVYLVTDRALYRMDMGSDGAPAVTWREEYANSGISKPGQVNAGSGTTPTLMGRDLVAITDNADPMNVVVHRRGRSVAGPRLLCSQPVFGKGASATDNSLIGTNDSLVVENNHGYGGPSSTEMGRTTTPGLARVDVDRATGRCSLAWESTETAPTVVPKLSAATGLVYTYTKDAREDRTDAWYLTAIDFRTGRTVWKALSGEGLGHNNNYAPVTLGADGTAFIGVLGGLVAMRDATPPPAAQPRGDVRPRRPRLRVQRRAGGFVRASVTGTGVRRVVFFVGRRRAAVDRRAPFVRRLRARGAGRVRARVWMADGRPLVLRRR